MFAEHVSKTGTVSSGKDKASLHKNTSWDVVVGFENL